MAENEPTAQANAETTPAATPGRGPTVAPSPHVFSLALTTRRMMFDVVLALLPVTAMAVLLFRWHAVAQVGVCVLSCVAAEALFTRLRGRPACISDGSAIVTGAILGLSLPWSAPWYVGVIGSAVAVGLGKAVFGGLGHNIFNPAMVGRAFVMLSFARELGASAYLLAESQLPVVTQATPLTLAKKVATDLAAGKIGPGEVSAQLGEAGRLWPLFIGNVNGSLGETSALACLLGGLYLCLRRTASWEIPAGVLLAGFALSGAANLLGVTPFTALQHIVSGSLFFGAFFIATDPVTSPLTPRGKFAFGLGVGCFVVLIRIFSGYPEGVMFAVLLMNTITPLLNRWTIPIPVGGPTARPKAP